MADVFYDDRYIGLLRTPHCLRGTGAGINSGFVSQCCPVFSDIESAKGLGVYSVLRFASVFRMVLVSTGTQLPIRFGAGPRVQQDPGMEPAYLLDLGDHLGHRLLRGVIGFASTDLVG